MNDHTNGTNGNGAYVANGHNNGNGNGHNKGIFDLAPKQDPLLSTVVPSARKRVAVMHKLSFGARNFFCWLTDQSLTPGANIVKGVLKISDHDAGARFKVHSKTIRNWKRELEDTGEVWLTEKWMKNSFPQTVYNITAIVGQATLPLNADSNDGSLVEDQVFSSNRRRQQLARRDPATGMFARRYPASPALVQTPPGVPRPEVSPGILQNQAENDTAGIILPPTTAMDCRPPRQPVAAHHGKTVPSPTATDCRPARQNGAAADGKTVPLPTATDCRGDRNQIAGNGKTENRESVLKEKWGEPTPPDNAFETWRKRHVTGAFTSKLLVLEKKIRAKLETAGSDAVKAGLRRQLKAVCDEMLPPVPDDPKPGPTRAVKPGPAKPRLSEAEQEAIREKVQRGALRAAAEAGL